MSINKEKKKEEKESILKKENFFKKYIKNLQWI